jgi:hypothetical protein
MHWPLLPSTMTLPATFAKRATLAVCVAVLATTPLRAAPIDSKDVSATLPAGTLQGLDPATTLPMPASGSGSPTGTVELLLQMQNQPVATPPAERKPTTGKTATISSTAAQSEAEPSSNALLELKSSLLGAGAPLGSEGASTREDRAGPGMSAPGVTGPSGPRGSSVGTRDSDSGLLANPVIRFIRSNRELAIGGSIALLVAVWLTANYRGRSHRRR